LYSEAPSSGEIDCEISVTQNVTETGFFNTEEKDLSRKLLMR
jgi:hypothetical protein